MLNTLQVLVFILTGRLVTYIHAYTQVPQKQHTTNAACKMSELQAPASANQRHTRGLYVCSSEMWYHGPLRSMPLHKATQKGDNVEVAALLAQVCKGAAATRAPHVYT